MEKINEAGAAPRSPTEQELQELEVALRAATPVPWVVVDRVFEDDRYYLVPRSAFESEAVRFKYWDKDEQIASICVPDRDGVRAKANTETIAAAVNAAPSLIAEVRRLRAAAAALRRLDLYLDFSEPMHSNAECGGKECCGPPDDPTELNAAYAEATGALRAAEDRPSSLGAAPGDSK